MARGKRYLLSTLALAMSQAFAQTPDVINSAGAKNSVQEDKSGGIETIVVTSRRTAEKLQEVPLSISALSAREMEAKGITSISELSQFTPGLSYSPDLGRNAERPVIRGISALRTDAPQPVSVFVDGVFIKDGALALTLDDAQRVEVIKGPQSALYGRATYAGAINYVTVKPGNDFEGRVSLTVADHDEQSLFTALTLPIRQDVLSARIKAKHSHYGGQYTNVQTDNKIGQERTDSTGIQVSITPTPKFNILATMDNAAIRDGQFPAVMRPVPIQAGGVVTSQNGSSNVPNGSECNGHLVNIVGTATTKANGWPCGAASYSGNLLRRNEMDLANYTDPSSGINYGNIAGLDRVIKRSSLTLNYTLDSGHTLTSQTARTSSATNLGADQSYDGKSFIFGTPWTTYDRDRMDYFSQEFRIVSPQDQQLTWLAGAFLYEEEARGKTSGVIALNSSNQKVADPLRPKPSTSIDNFAPFGRIQYALTNDLRISAEGRYSKETIKVGGPTLGTAVVTAGTCVAGQSCALKGERTFKKFEPRITLDFKLSPESMMYGQWARGSKSGGFNATPGLSSSEFAYDGETVTAVELGYKSTLLDNRMTFNAALFQNTVDGLQLSNTAPYTNPMTGLSTTTTIVNNVGKARTRGLEFDVSARVNSWLRLSGNYAYTDAKAISGTETTNGTVFGGDISVAGFTLPRTPKHSATFSANVEFPVEQWGGLKFFARSDVTYQSRRYAEIQNMIWADPYTRVNLSAGLKGKDWKATLFIKNATNNVTPLNGFRYFDSVTFRRTAVDFLSRERQAGVTLSYDF
ncbi:TonB-dependent receptor [Denitratisoma oestradiolicum]|uniref:Putative TonB-dependent receptor n=1 Tax=Denitratisoma oestradiolicum TaxID=311182 RepID=A0A6S6Y2L0_9PROT|nr:TonB-dependent receptor [Denitratisoma oestradiolicum]TWO78720.1 hypothetical protein CBW56_18590 [Denitratisoma oestradiolicum]CAB1369563.1 putative TonB-dependent receptor [Denitratisoma oestradiolicum]